MKSENTPIYIDLPNYKENLITPSQPVQKKDPKNMNTDKFFILEEKPSPDEPETITITFCYYRAGVIFLSIVLLPLSLLPIISIVSTPEEERWDIITILYKVILSLIFVLIMLVLLIFSNNKIVVSKNKIEKKVIINVINFLCFSKEKIILDIENVFFDVTFKERNVVDENDNEVIEYVSTKLYIYNNYKNLVGINLDRSDIKQKPAKLIYRFNNITNSNYNAKQLKTDLNKFIGNKNYYYKNPLDFNISNYMLKNDNNISLFEGQYIKFHENFFTYHFVNPIKYTVFGIFMTVLFIISNIVIIFLIVLMLLNQNGIMILKFVCSLIIINILLYILYSCIKSKTDNIYRIDCIYSKDFNRIFIGVVKYTTTSYINTFEHQIDDIDSFIFQKVGFGLLYDLKAVFKNKEKQKICRIKGKSQQNLLGLAHLLNEKLSVDDTDNDNDNDNDDIINTKI